MLIPRGILKLRSVASQSKSRYALNGVCIERKDGDTCRAVATDGKALALVEWNDANRHETDGLIDAKTTRPGLVTVLPVSGLNTIDKAIPKRKQFANAQVRLEEPSVNGHANLVHPVSDGDVEFKLPTVEGNFPPYEDVLKGEEGKKETIRIGLNIGLLYNLVRALQEAKGTGDAAPVARLEIVDEFSAVRVTVSGGCGDPSVTRAVGLLMPVNLA